VDGLSGQYLQEARSSIIHTANKPQKILDIFGGFGGAREAACKAGITIADDGYYLIEIDETKRFNMGDPFSHYLTINYPNECSDKSFRMMHNIPWDIRNPDLAREIRAIAQDLTWLIASFPCQAVSIASASRPGFQEHTETFLFNLAHDILQIVLEENPACNYIFECTAFPDMPAPWSAIEERLGRAIIIDAAAVSACHRIRAIWSNLLSVITHLPYPVPQTDLADILDYPHVPIASPATDQAPFDTYNIQGMTQRKAPTLMASPMVLIKGEWQFTHSIRNGTALVQNMVTGNTELRSIQEDIKCMGYNPIAFSAMSTVTQGFVRHALGDSIQNDFMA